MLKNSKKGQKAVRKAIDVNWGYDKNPWCLAARKNGFRQEEIDDQLTEEQNEQLGLYSDDELATAWSLWSQSYTAYPKRICFKNGRLLAFSAGANENLVEWWDKNDQSYEDLEELAGVKDDPEFLQKYGKVNLIKYGDLDEETIWKLADDETHWVRSAIIQRKDLPPEVIEKLANDESYILRWRIALRKDLPPKAIRKLADDEYWNVRKAIAKSKDLPPELVEKLANDEDWDVRWEIAKRKDLTPELVRKLANDRSYAVREEIAKRKDLPHELVEKLANDENWSVRLGIARRKDLPPELIEKLANDENNWVRSTIRRNYNV